MHLNLQDDGVARRILIDLDPLRESRDFRLLFGGQLIGMFGTQLTMVAIPFQVYDLTRSSFQVGAVSLAQLVPLIVGALVGGMVGDAVDRRVILLVTSAALALTSGALAVNATLTHPSMAVIYAVSAVAAGFGGIYSTACSSVVPSLVRARQLVAAFATMQVVDQAGMVVGPALSGVLIGAVQLGWVYAIDAVTFVLAGSTVALMAAMPPVAGGRGPGLGSLRQLFGLIGGRQVLLGGYLIDINAMVFGAPRALFPALAVSVFHGGRRTLGLLYAAPAAGALVGAGTTGWLGPVTPPGSDRHRRGVRVGSGHRRLRAGPCTGDRSGPARSGRLGRRHLGRVAHHHPPVLGARSPSHPHRLCADGRGRGRAPTGRLRIGSGGHGQVDDVLYRVGRGGLHGRCSPAGQVAAGIPTLRTRGDARQGRRPALAGYWQA